METMMQFAANWRLMALGDWPYRPSSLSLFDHVANYLSVVNFCMRKRKRYRYAELSPRSNERVTKCIEIPNTVVPALALGDPRRERPPALYGHVINAPTDTFQR